jgi:O-methyltransferase
MFNVRDYPLVSDQIEYPELSVIIRELYTVLEKGVTGCVVELGCYTGTTSLFIQRLLTRLDMAREFHVYDSFSGLPPKAPQDQSPAGTQFKAGELTASKQILIKNFKQANIPLPTIHKAWFEQLTTNDMPAEIAFAFLDGDFYTSIKASLEILTPLLSPGACVVVDDYQSEALPGARRAVDEWALRHNYSVRAEQSLAIIHIYA